MSCRPSQQKEKMILRMGDEPKSRRTSVTLPIDILKKIKGYCLDHNKNLSEVFIEAFAFLTSSDPAFFRKNSETQKRNDGGMDYDC